MTSAQLVNLKGKNQGEVTLNETVFGLEPNTDVLFNALQRQLANARSGSANSKTRSEVRGGGRKPWRQKGTGRARAGSIRSPLWAGGGVIFGPKPRDFSINMPKKMRQLALKSALSARKDDMVIVSDFADLKHAKTKEFAQAMKDLGIADKKTLLVLDFGCEECTKVQRAARNIAALKVVHVNDINVKDLLDCQTVLTTKRVIEILNDRFQPKADADETAAASKKRAPKDAAPKKEAKVKAEKPAKKAESKKAEPKKSKKKDAE